MSDVILSTQYQGVTLKLRWGELRDHYLLTLSNNEISYRLPREPVNSQLSFDLKGEKFWLRARVFRSMQAEMIGIYHLGLPYKLYAFNIKDYESLSVSNLLNRGNMQDILLN
ncbi:hypothetical protein [Planctobacterium marinum]